MSGNHGLHPTHDELTAYGLGKLHPPESVAIETHIAECEECCETLHDLGNDTFADLVRESKVLQLESVDDAGTIGLDEIGNETVSDLPSELTNHPRYRVLELIGKGGMGNVYKAEHTLMSRAVALKVINRELVQNAQAVERFRREVKSAAQLAHPNIVAAYDAEQAGDMHLLVMEHVPGANLSDVVKQDGPLEIPLACDFILQSARGLQHAHEKGMVHRDVKPHNLMVTADGCVKILDFGLATLTAGAFVKEENNAALRGNSDREISPALTSAGSMMGTPDFISPEQATDARAADIRSDIYSLGCTFYYLLTGRPPFVEGSALERVKAHEDAKPDAIENVRVDLPEEVADVVKRMMAKDPAERFQTPVEVADALAPFVNTYRTTAAQENHHTPEKVALPLQRSPWPPSLVLTSAFGAFALVLGAIIYVATDRGTLEVRSEDESVEITILAVRPELEDGRAGTSGSELRITDTVTGSIAKRLRSGEYVLDVNGDTNSYELSRNRFVLKRGDRIIVTVTRRNDADIESHAKVVSDASESGASDRIPTERRIWASQKHLGLRSVSRDGLRLPFIDWESLGVGLREVNAKQNRDLLESLRTGYSDSIPIISPDGQRIVLNKYENDWPGYRLQICGVDDVQPKDLYRNDDVQWLAPYDWSPDGQTILTLLSRKDKTQQMALISATDGSERIIKSFDWNGPSNMKFAPDGHSIVYDRNVQRDSTRPENHDIFVLMVAQNREIPLVEHPADDSLLGSAPDGRTILFASDRQGGEDAWAIDASGTEEPTLVKKRIGDVNPIGFDSGATFYYSTSPQTDDVYVVMIDEDSGQVILPSRKISRLREGANRSPDWSPDGRRLAYVHTQDRISITIFNIETEQYEELFPDLAYIRGKGPRWAPNSESFILAGADNKGRRGIFQVDAQSGESTLLVRTRNGRRPASPEWTPDGKSILFTEFGGSSSGWAGANVAMRIRNLENDEEREIPGDFHSSAEPSFCLSSDGQHLIYATRVNKTAKLSIVPVEGGQPRLLFEKEQRRIGRCTLAGSDVVFEMDRPDEETELWKVSVNGGDARSLGLVENGLSTNGYLHPRISPDGKRIAFNASTHDENTVRTEVFALENFLLPVEDKTLDKNAPVALDRRIALRMVWGNAIGALGTPSSDGRSVSFVDWDTGDLAVRDLIKGTNRRLTNKGSWDQSSEFAEFSVFAPDGKHVAYHWFNNDNFFDLRVIGSDGGKPRVLYSNEESTLTPHAWSPDGHHVLGVLSRKGIGSQIVLVSAADGAITVLKSLEWRYPRKMCFSPDGQYIVYDVPAQETSPEHDILMLAVDGSREAPLVEHSADDVILGWAPHRNSVLFASNRTGTWDAWLIEIADEKPHGPPQLVKPDLGAVWPMGFASNGSYYFVVHKGMNDVYTAKLDLETGTIDDQPRIASQRRVGSNMSADWSPDGRYLAYLSNEGPPQRGGSRANISILSVESGQLRRLSPKLNYISPKGARWSPKGDSLLVAARDAQNRRGIHLVNVENGDLTTVVRGGWDAEWSPDAKAIYYQRPAGRRIVKRDMESGQEEEVLRVDVLESAPMVSLRFAISPDGEQIAFTTHDDGKQWGLKRMPIAGGEAVELTDERFSRIRTLQWTADGKYLAFQTLSDDDASDGLWRIPAAGGEPRKLRLDNRGARLLRVHPDGRGVAFTASPQEAKTEFWVLENFLPRLTEGL